MSDVKDSWTNEQNIEFARAVRNLVWQQANMDAPKSGVFEAIAEHVDRVEKKNASNKALIDCQPMTEGPTRTFPYRQAKSRE